MTPRNDSRRRTPYMPTRQLSLRSLFFLTSAVAFGLYVGRLDPSLGLFAAVILLLARRRAVTLAAADDVSAERVGRTVHLVSHWLSALLTEITLCFLTGGALFVCFAGAELWFGVSFQRLDFLVSRELVGSVYVWCLFTIWLGLHFVAHNAYLAATLERRPKLPTLLPAITAEVVAEPHDRGATRRKLTHKPGAGLNPPERFRRHG